MKMLRGLSVLLSACRLACRRLCNCISSSPIVFLIATVVLLLIVCLVALFNLMLIRLFTLPGSILINVLLVWLFLQLVVRILVFPGSLIMWKRSTEGTYKAEMSKQFVSHLQQLRIFLGAASGGKPLDQAHMMLTMEGVIVGCSVAKGLAQNFRAQIRDQVKLNGEQTQVKVLVHVVETWLLEAQVVDRKVKNGTPILLTDWLQGLAQSLVPVPISYAVSSASLTKEAERGVDGCVESIDALIAIFEGLQNQQDGCCTSARKFFQEPTVGNLHQMRAELKMRYSGQHCWVRTSSGRKLDGMFIACNPNTPALSEELAVEFGGLPPSEAPLKADPGPVILWCNANAAYYETMAFESQWLNFYLEQGCSVFVFNYSGYGRSGGRPSAKNLAADSKACVEFLKRRGVTQLGVHGRSIGGIAACGLAKAFPDVVKIMIADRTFSTLSEVAKYTFGNWAVHGLRLATTSADNWSAYYQARCYKVSICDPKDTVIPDVAALRSRVALEALQQIPASERLTMEEDKIRRLVDAWAFFDTLVGICDPGAGGGDGGDRECQGCPGCGPAGTTTSASSSGSRRPSSRQLVVGKQQNDSDDGRIGDQDEERQRLLRKGGFDATALPSPGIIDAKWLADNLGQVKAVMTNHVDALRVAIDVVGTQLNASGLTLEDTLSRSRSEACQQLRCFLANLQVWGSIGSLREPLRAGIDREIELFLQRGDKQETREQQLRVSRVKATLTPERLSAYHKRLSRSFVAQARREFRQHLSSLRRALEAPACGEEGSVSRELCSSTLYHLQEIEAFTTALYRFFQCVDLLSVSDPSAPFAEFPKGSSGTSISSLAGCGMAGLAGDTGVSDDSEKDESQKQMTGDGLPAPCLARPRLDRSLIGYVLTVACGHNGCLSDGEAQHLAQHLRAARFGKYAA